MYQNNGQQGFNNTIVKRLRECANVTLGLGREEKKDESGILSHHLPADQNAKIKK